MDVIRKDYDNGVVNCQRLATVHSGPIQMVMGRAWKLTGLLEGAYRALVSLNSRPPLRSSIFMVTY